MRIVVQLTDHNDKAFANYQRIDSIFNEVTCLQHTTYILYCSAKGRSKRHLGIQAGTGSLDVSSQGDRTIATCRTAGEYGMGVGQAHISLCMLLSIRTGGHRHIVVTTK